MSMSYRFQIPVTKAENRLYHCAAKIEGLSAAEWARRHLREKAKQMLTKTSLTPEEALKQLFGLEAPVGPVEKMIQESLRGRYR